MKVLITGATGLIGQHLGLFLVENNHEVVVLARNVERAKLQLPFPCSVHEWDLFSGEAPKDAFAGVDAVVHLAGFPIADGRWTKSRREKIMQSRVKGTRHLVQTIAGLENKPKVFLSASGIGFYSFSETEIFDESSNPGDGFLSDVCKKWEREALELESVDHSIRKVIVRIGLVLSSNGGALDKMVPLAQEGVLGAAGSGRQKMSWIHITDLVRSMAFALETQDFEGVYNGVSPQVVTNSEFTKSLMARFDKKPFLPAPSIALRLLYGDMSQLILQGQHVVPKKLRDNSFRFEFESIDSAMQDLFPSHEKGEKRVVYKQWVPAKIDKVFSFYKDEKNLERITPEFLNFKVLDKTTDEIQSGTRLRYQLNLKGFPFKWETLIKEFKENEYFIDTQLKGPYKKWFHTHYFSELGGGTLVTDEVKYKLPLGILGRIAAGWMVAGDVRKIFNYRRKVMGNIFNVRVKA